MLMTTLVYLFYWSIIALLYHILGGVAHMVERSLCMREARGTISRTSTFYHLLFMLLLLVPT
jgi:succinate dehydrogenase/fumarate reductase cytochrome b subunit